MPGKRQHYLPRFLQSGFASKGDGPASLVWLYRRGQIPVRVSTRDVGVSSRFYGHANSRPDTDLTAFDDALGATVQVWRNSPTPLHGIDAEAVKLCTNLALRGRYIRQVYAHVTGTLIDAVESKLRDPDAAFRWIRKYIERNPEEFRAMMRRDLSRRSGPISETELDEIIDYIMDNLPAFVNRNLLDIESMRAPLREVRDKLRKIIDDAHNSVLLKDIVPEPREELVRHIRWKVESFGSDHNFVLGDCGPIAQTADGAKSLGWTSRDDTVMNVVLPISDKRALIGESGADSRMGHIPDINAQIAQCSHEYFISGTRCSAHEDLISSIGTRSVPLSNDAVEAMVDKWFQ